MAFALDLQKYADKTKQSMGEAVREVVMMCATLIDERSPVGNKALWTQGFIDAANKLGWITDSGAGYLGGHFRANNQYKFGSAPTGEVEGEDPSGAEAMTKIRTSVFTSPVAGLHYIANTVPYATALENGHSTQAPQGIYGLAAIDAAGAANAVIKARFA